MKKQPQIFQLKEKEYFQQINPETGEIIGDVISADVIVKEIPRAGFAITYLSAIVQMIDGIGNKKMQVVKYILKNMDSNNLLTQTVREIARGCECSIQTVNDTLKILEQCQIVSRKTGLVMLSPKLMHKGNAKRERFLLTKFFEIQNSDFAETHQDLIENLKTEQN